jgi:uncharacterized delta-60 repeat protein
MRGTKTFAACVALGSLVAAGCAGQPDSDFGTGGSTHVGVLLYDRTYDIAVQPDGKILAVGASSQQWDGSSGQVFSAVRLNTDGSLDTSFGGGDGKVTVDFPGIASERATSVVVLSDGAIVLGGEPVGDSCTDGWLFAQLNPDGTLDADEGNQTPRNGTAVWHASVFDEDIRLAGLSELVALPNNQFFVAGGNVVSKFGGSFGSLFPDPLFGGRVGEEEGFVRYDDDPNSDFGCHTVFDVTAPMYVATAGHIYSGSTSIVALPGPNWFFTVDVQPDGKVLASGWTTIVSKPFIARFLPDGTLDTTFQGTYGPLPPGGYQEGAATDFAVQADSKILAFGGGEVRRLNPDGTLDTTFGTDGAVPVPGAEGSSSHSPEGGFAVQPDGKLLAGGAVASGLDLDDWIGRFTP